MNRIWRVGRSAGSTRVYKAAPAVQWDHDAVLLLRAARWRTLLPGCYWLALSLALHTRRHDIDAPLKLALDAVATALDIDDACIGLLTVVKLLMLARAAERLDLRAVVHPVAGTEARDCQSASLGGQHV